MVKKILKTTVITILVTAIGGGIINAATPLQNQEVIKETKRKDFSSVISSANTEQPDEKKEKILKTTALKTVSDVKQKTKTSEVTHEKASEKVADVISTANQITAEINTEKTPKLDNEKLPDVNTEETPSTEEMPEQDEEEMPDDNEEEETENDEEVIPDKKPESPEHILKPRPEFYPEKTPEQYYAELQAMGQDIPSLAYFWFNVDTGRMMHAISGTMEYGITYETNIEYYQIEHMDEGYYLIDILGEPEGIIDRSVRVLLCYSKTPVYNKLNIEYIDEETGELIKTQTYNDILRYTYYKNMDLSLSLVESYSVYRIDGNLDGYITEDTSIKVYCCKNKNTMQTHDIFD